MSWLERVDDCRSWKARGGRRGCLWRSQSIHTRRRNPWSLHASVEVGGRRNKAEVGISILSFPDHFGPPPSDQKFHQLLFFPWLMAFISDLLSSLVLRIGKLGFTPRLSPLRCFLPVRLGHDCGSRARREDLNIVVGKESSIIDICRKKRDRIRPGGSGEVVLERVGRGVIALSMRLRG